MDGTEAKLIRVRSARNPVADPRSSRPNMVQGGLKGRDARRCHMTIPPPRIVELLPALMRYARRLARDQSDAEDLVQETLASAYAHIGQYQPGRSLRVWLFTILHNSFISRTRHDAVRERHRTGTAPAAAEASPQEHSVRLREIAEALDRLSPEQRQVLHLVAVDGLSYQEAADAIGIPIGTLISRLSRARARLRAIESGEAGDSRPPVALRIVES